MARINIEDSIFKEKAFEKLMLRLGSKRAALGALMEAFILAQKHYLTTVNDRLIPLNEWKREEIADEIIDCGFAEVREKGIYVRGSAEQFAWLAQRSEAGKTSARLKAEKKSTTVDGRSTVVNDSQPLTLSPSLSQKENKEGEGAAAPHVSLTENIKIAWGAWNATLERFGASPSGISPNQERTLVLAIRNIGFENVLLAIEGKRYEKPFDGYDPKTNLSLQKLLGPNRSGQYNWERFANMARVEREKKVEVIDYEKIGRGY